MTFEALWSAYEWTAIRSCPGRFVAQSVSDAARLDMIVRAGGTSIERRVDGARDVVVIAQFDDGGLIAYRRADGRYRHTLNTAAGFERKLRQLGFSLP